MRGISPPFSPPEAFFDGEKTTKFDIWSYGVTLYSLFGNRKPWYKMSYMQIENHLRIYKKFYMEDNLNMHPKIEALIKLCTSYQPNDRPDADEVYLILKNIM